MDALHVALVLMLAAFLVQNYAEWRGGGPDFSGSPRLLMVLPANTQDLRQDALWLISGLVIALLVVGVSLHADWLLAMIASALAFNALWQGLASVMRGSVVPGTGSGLVLMLPASLLVLFFLPLGSLWPFLLAGPILSIPLLLAVWWIAAWIKRR